MLGRHFSSDTSKTFMHGNIDCMEQPEEYHKMAVPGMLKCVFLHFTDTSIYFLGGPYSVCIGNVFGKFLHREKLCPKFFSQVRRS